MTKEHDHQASDGAKAAEIAEIVTVTVELHRHGAPVETVKVECDGEPTHRHLAEKLAEVLTLEVEDLVEEFADEQRMHDVAKRHSKLELECVDVHFETQSATHHFLSRMKWNRVHQWACKKFKIASNVSANLELRDGSQEGPALNESKPIGEFEGCRTVWLVKPGPEPNGY